MWLLLFPELSTEEEEEEEEGEDGSSDEFTDSIEDDDKKVTSRSLVSSQVNLFTSTENSLPADETLSTNIKAFLFFCEASSAGERDRRAGEGSAVQGKRSETARGGEEDA